MKRMGLLIVVAALALSGCTTTVNDPPAPDASSPSPAAPVTPQVGDEITPLEAWDICFAHTTTQVQSDVTEWREYSEDLVEQPGVGQFIVTIDDVRSGNDADDAGTVTCTIEGRAGGVFLSSWDRS